MLVSAPYMLCHSVSATRVVTGNEANKSCIRLLMFYFKREIRHRHSKINRIRKKSKENTITEEKKKRIINQVFRKRRWMDAGRVGP